MGGKSPVKKTKAKMYALEFVMWAASLVIWIPLILIAVNAVKTPAETNVLTLSLPQSWQFENFAEVFRETSIVRSFFNSVLVTVCSIGLSVFLGTLAGYTLNRNSDGPNKKIYVFFLAGMIVPVQIIALIQVLQKLHLMDN